MTTYGKAAAVAAIAIAGTSFVLATPVEAKKGGKHFHQMAAAEMTGRVSRIMVNPYGEADGLLLDNGTAVRFPAHMSDRLTATVRRGDTVMVRGQSNIGRDVKAWSIANQRTGHILAAEPKPYLSMTPPKFVRYSMLKPMTVTGTVAQVTWGKRGEVKSAILEDGTVAKIGRHLQLAAQSIKPGMRVSFTGRGTTTSYGRGIEVETI